MSTSVSLYHNTIVGNVLVSSIKVECCIIEVQTRASKIERDKENKGQRRGNNIRWPPALCLCRMFELVCSSRVEEVSFMTIECPCWDQGCISLSRLGDIFLYKRIHKKLLLVNCLHCLVTHTPGVVKWYSIQPWKLNSTNLSTRIKRAREKQASMWREGFFIKWYLCKWMEGYWVMGRQQWVLCWIEGAKVDKSKINNEA